MVALMAGVVGAIEMNRAEHGVDDLPPVALEFGLVPIAAVRARSAVPSVQFQQPLQQAATQLGHRGADGQLGHLQAPAGGVSQQTCCQLAEACYLTFEFLLELPLEPLLLPPASGGWSWARTGTGRASQICWLTSTISSTTARNRL